MPGTPHKLIVLELRDRPELLAELLHRFTGVRPAGPFQVVDSAVRLAPSLEKRPDLLFSVPPSDSGPAPWLLVEVQNQPDAQKAKSWHLITSVLLQKGGMGDLVVITPSRAVARWAKRVAHHRGALGTVKGLTPVVIPMPKEQVSQLLDPKMPELALFAVWAGARDDSPAAKRVVERAIEVTDELPQPLRDQQTRAILAMLGRRLFDALKETAMDMTQIPETKAMRSLRRFFVARIRRREDLADPVGADDDGDLVGNTGSRSRSQPATSGR